MAGNAPLRLATGKSPRHSDCVRIAFASGLARRIGLPQPVSRPWSKAWLGGWAVMILFPVFAVAWLRQATVRGAVLSVGAQRRARRAPVARTGFPGHAIAGVSERSAKGIPFLMLQHRPRVREHDDTDALRRAWRARPTPRWDYRGLWINSAGLTGGFEDAQGGRSRKAGPAPAVVDDLCVIGANAASSARACRARAAERSGMEMIAWPMPLTSTSWKRATRSSASWRSSICCPDLIRQAIAAAPGWADHLKGVDPGAVTSREALARLPVLRKSGLHQLQARRAAVRGLRHGAGGGDGACLHVAGADLRARGPRRGLVAGGARALCRGRAQGRHRAQHLRLPSDPWRLDPRLRARARSAAP